MDPLSGLALASSCMSLATKSGTLILRTTIFISEVRNARRDLDAVSRELTSLQLCLSALKDDQQLGLLNLPEDMRNHISQILVNIDLILNQINDMLIKLSSGKLGRRIQWATTEKENMSKFRCSLESNKSALEIALTIGSISMLAKQTESMTKQDTQVELLVQRTESISLTTNLIDGKIDVLTNMHRGDTRLDSITQEIGFLRTQLTDLASKTSNATLNAFRKESEVYTQSLLQPIAPTLPDTNVFAITSMSLQQSSAAKTDQPCASCESHQALINTMRISSTEKEYFYQEKLDALEREKLRLLSKLKVTTDSHDNDRSALLQSHHELERLCEERRLEIQSLREKETSYQRQISELESNQEERSSATDNLLTTEDDLRRVHHEENNLSTSYRKTVKAWPDHERSPELAEDIRMWWSQTFPKRSLSSAGLDPSAYGAFFADDMRGLRGCNKALQENYKQHALVSERKLQEINTPLALFRIVSYNDRRPGHSYIGDQLLRVQCKICFILNDHDARLTLWNQTTFEMLKSVQIAQFSVASKTVDEIKRLFCHQLKKANASGPFTNMDALFIQHPHGGRIAPETKMSTIRTSGWLFLMLSPLDEHLGTSSSDDVYEVRRNILLTGPQGRGNAMYSFDRDLRGRLIFQPKGLLRDIPWPIAHVSKS